MAIIATKTLVFAQKRGVGLVGISEVRLYIHMAMSKVPSFMNLMNELDLTLCGYLYTAQPHTYVVLAIIATKTLVFAPKRGLA